jgi:hypothetical protein
MTDFPTRLLRKTLRGRLTAAPSSGCVDTDTLAAWSDGALSTRERAAAESHASSCARCQALLAAMARTNPPAPRRAWWRSATVGWLVPVAAAAVAVLVWINVPASRVALPAATAPHTADAARTDAPGSPAQKPSAPDTPPASDARATALATPAERATRRPPIVAPQRETRADARRTAPSADPALPDLRPATPPAIAPKAVSEAVAVSPPAAAPAPAPVQGTVQNPAAEAARGAPAPASPNAAPDPTRTARGLSDRTASRLRTEAVSKILPIPTEIVSPDVNVRWRILTGGIVARSIDGGTTWQTQSTGVAAAFAAGSAPSPTICWLVGPAGIIVLSTDGRTWQRVPFPEGIDLASIRASGSVNATVTAADGRTFITSDGGKTWRPQ